MAGNANRGGAGMVYHWKHGWIPRTPGAALQKAHGSHKGASKLMNKHGIEGDLPGGKGKSDGGKSGVAKSHPIGATVEARQPGIDNVTHGKVAGHTDSGMVQVAHTGHNGKPLVGTFNPSHTQVVKSGHTPAANTPHAAPHTLKPGEHATVRGIDHMGQPMTLTGKVMANGEVSSFAKGRTTGGQPLRSISIQKQDNSNRQNVVYVPDPNRGESKRGAAAANAAAKAEKPRVQADAGSAHATRAAELRAAAAKKRAESARIAGSVGAPDRAGAMLRAKDSQRMNARMDSGLRRSVEATRQAKALESKAHLAEGRAKSAADKQRAANLNLKPSDVTPGDMVLHNGRLQIVTKVNKTTVNVPSGYSWDDKVPLSKVTRHVPLSTQSDGAIRKAFDQTKDAKVKSALRAELLRRGLSVA